jgi:hypothetical protein
MKMIRKERAPVLIGVVLVASMIAIVTGSLSREVYSNVSATTPSTNSVLRAANVAGMQPCRVRTSDAGIIELPNTFQSPTKRVSEFAQRANGGPLSGVQSCVVSLHGTDVTRCAKSGATNRFYHGIVGNLHVVPSSSDMDGNDLECLVSFIPNPRAAQLHAYAAKVDPDAMNAANGDLARRLGDADLRIAQMTPLIPPFIIIPRDPASSVLTQFVNFTLPVPTLVKTIHISGFPAIRASAPGTNNYIIRVLNGAQVISTRSINVDTLSQLNIDSLIVNTRLTRLSIMNNGVSNFVHPRFNAFTNAQLNAVVVRAFT